MAEYIKREAALRIVENYGKSAIESGRKTLDPVDDIINLATGVDLIPAEDVVEVVRCKDCKFAWVHPMGGTVYCGRDGRKTYPMQFQPTDFCSYGKKGVRESEKN